MYLDVKCNSCDIAGCKVCTTIRQLAYHDDQDWQINEKINDVIKRKNRANFSP